jgi:hypothetical protein
VYDHPVGSRLAVAAIVLVALAAVVHSWTVFSQVVDEPAHVAAGVEWLDAGTYALDRQHPPLARIFSGIGPMLRGATYVPRGHWTFTGNAILYGNGSYVATLASARAGTLVFFLLACAIVYVWTRKLYGEGAAIAALLLFATQPAVIAHAALATTDMAAAATVLAALFALHAWMERSTTGRAALLGVAIAAALTAKFSAVVFLPAAFVAVVLGARPSPAFGTLSPQAGRGTHEGSVARAPFSPPRGEKVPKADEGSAITILVTLFIAILGILAVYRFQAGFLEGIAEVRAHNRGGHPSYLFGEVRREGWWIYFPVALWFKSTIPLLLAFAYGAYGMIRKRAVSWIPLAAGAAILVVAMMSRISIGVRHVLVLYPLMAMIAAYGIVQLRRPLAALVVIAQLGSFALAHPDHLAYFNITAGRDPSRILLDSNLDWGQDVLRLEKAAARHGIDTLHVAIFTSADLRKHRLPPLRPLRPFVPAKGWIAISEMQLKDLGARDRPRGGYDWLLRYEPVERVGKSILLYRIHE